MFLPSTNRIFLFPASKAVTTRLVVSQCFASNPSHNENDASTQTNQTTTSEMVTIPLTTRPSIPSQFLKHRFTPIGARSQQTRVDPGHDIQEVEEDFEDEDVVMLPAVNQVTTDDEDEAEILRNLSTPPAVSTSTSHLPDNDAAKESGKEKKRSKKRKAEEEEATKSSRKKKRKSDS